MHSGDRCIIDMFYVYLKAMDEEGPFYRRPLPPEGSQKIHFAQQTLEINKFKYFMKIIAERGELREFFTILSGTRTGDMHQRHVLKDFQNKKVRRYKHIHIYNSYWCLRKIAKLKTFQGLTGVHTQRIL